MSCLVCIFILLVSRVEQSEVNRRLQFPLMALAVLSNHAAGPRLVTSILLTQTPIHGNCWLKSSIRSYISAVVSLSSDMYRSLAGVESGAS